MTLNDKVYLDEAKARIVGKCTCKGEDLNCGCWRLFRQEIKKVNAEIPIKYRQYDFSQITHPQIQQSKQQIIDYCISMHEHLRKGTGLYLWGDSGLAKTALGTIVLQEALSKGYSAYFTTLSKCVTYLTHGWHGDETENNLIDRILSVDFLMIDQIGFEYKPSSGLTESTFNTVFQERANKMLPVILTSNLDSFSLGGIFGKQIISLFNEHLLNISFKGVDYRNIIQQAKESKKHDRKTSSK